MLDDVTSGMSDDARLCALGARCWMCNVQTPRTLRKTDEIAAEVAEQRNAQPALALDAPGP